MSHTVAKIKFIGMKKSIVSLFCVAMSVVFFMGEMIVGVSAAELVKPNGSNQLALKAERQIIVRFKPSYLSDNGLSGSSVDEKNGDSPNTAALNKRRFMVKRPNVVLPAAGLEFIKHHRIPRKNKKLVGQPAERKGTSELNSARQQSDNSDEPKTLDISVLRITDPNAKRKDIIKALIASGQVEYAEPDTVIHASVSPDDTDFGTMWGLNNTGQSGGTVDADIDAIEAWDITTGSESVVVAVIDTGIQYDHPDLAPNMWVNPGEIANNGLDDDNNGYVDDVYGIDCVNNDGDPYDDNASVYHGTHVAGTIGAQGNNNNQVVGVNWEVSLMALKTLDAGGSGVTSDSIECLSYAINMKNFYGVNVKVSNNSYGGSGYTQAMYNAIEAAKDAGILFVAAAGNDGLDNDEVPHYPSSYNNDNVIAVANTNRNDGIASDSNYGKASVDVGAPGSSILSTSVPNGTKTLSGTSMASPHVAGVTALLWANDPARTWQTVKGLILDTAEPIAELDDKTQTGSRINAFKALTCVDAKHLYLLGPFDQDYLRIGQDNEISVRLSNCGEAVTAATVNVITDNAEPSFVLLDNGVAPDVAAGDGVYSAYWQPTIDGSVVLTIDSDISGTPFQQQVSVMVVDVPSYTKSVDHPYAWTEISDSTDIGLGNLDDAGTKINIGFDFAFYGITYSDIWVHTNGMLKFGSDVELSFFEFLDLPSVIKPNNFIAPFWEDLNPVTSGTLYSKLEGIAPNRRLVIEWHELLHFNNVREALPSTVTFQAILYEGSNDIVLQYKDLSMGLPEYDNGARAMVGIEIFDGSEGIAHINQGLIANAIAEQQAILFSSSGGLKILTVNEEFSHGSVTADLGQIGCGSQGSQCFGQYATNTVVTLTATADADYRFAGWSGAGCSGLGTCVVTLDDHKTVTPSFEITPAVIVTPVSGLVTGEDGTTAQFMVSLTTLPSSSVTIDLASDDASEGTVSPSQLVFTAVNGMTAQIVTVTGVNDDLDDGDIAYNIITQTTVSGDFEYSGLSVSDVALSNSDDGDTVGVTTTAPASPTSSESGGQFTFGVVLDSQPTGTVTISLASSNSAEASVLPSSLIFDDTNWSTAQTVTVTGQDDEVDDGNVGYSITIGVESNGDAAYAAINPPDITAINTDNDSAGVNVTASANLTTTEAGGTDSFSVVLNSQPTAIVSIALSLSDTSEASLAVTSLSFGVNDWNDPQTVIVTGKNDDIDDGDIAYTVVLDAATSADSKYNGIDADDVDLVNQDDDAAAVIVSAAVLTTTEIGGQATFTIVLQSEPTADVVISFSTSDMTEGSVSPSSATFNTGNWSQAQTITITGEDDNIDDGDVSYDVLITAAQSSDGVYDGMTIANLSVTNTDDDQAGIEVVAADGLSTSEAGGVVTFTVVLLSEPTDTVTIDVSSSDTSEGSVSPSSLVFTPSTWLTIQTVTVTGVNDDIDDGDISYQALLAAATSNDMVYSGVNAQDVAVSNVDDDTAGITVTASANLITTEAGGSVNFTIQLDSEPTDPVTISVSSSNTLEGTVSPSELVFGSINWDQAQTVSITGVDDFVDDGDVAYSVILAAASSSDTNYLGLNPDDVDVTNQDDDSAGYTVFEAESFLTTEAGGQTSFTVQLSSQPTHSVSLGLSSSDTSEGLVDVNTITFAPDTWSDPQTVIITGVEDYIDDGDVAYSIEWVAATSDDANYVGSKPADLSTSNIDDDSIGILVSPTTDISVAETGTSAQFTVVLQTIPSASVSVNISSSDLNEASVDKSELIFSITDALIPQTVTVVGQDDALLDGDIAFTINIAPTVSADADYNGIDPPDLMGVNIDDDIDSDEDGVADIRDNCPNDANANQMDSDWDELGDVCDADADNDEIPNEEDNCPLDNNPAQKDTDSDDLGDACDLDSDNDHVTDSVDTDPLDPSLCQDLDADSCDDCSIGVDGFGVLNDADPNNDGLDTDADGECNEGDLDDDNDGILDVDDDGIQLDNCPLVANVDQADKNNDGIGDACTLLSVDEDFCFPIVTVNSAVVVICL